MDMDRMAGRYRQLQRATVARSALDVIAIIFLWCGFAFWAVAFWQLLAPPALLSLLSIQVIVLALVYSLATPLLWSALVPSTPAGQLLQKTQWRTFGFAAIVAAAIYLSYQAEMMIELWLYAQKAVREAHFERPLAMSLSIAFILIPALAWTQLTPERWLQQIQQAHQVRKLEIEQRGELAIVKASLIRAEILAARGWANLLPLEKEEVVKTLQGLLMGSADSMRSVVKTLGYDAELSRSIMNDDEIAEQLEYVKNAIDVVPTIGRAIPAEGETTALVPHQGAAPVSLQPRPASAGVPAPPRPAAPRRAPPLYAAEYEKALVADDLATGMWSPGQLGMVFGKSERTARTWIGVWESAGLVGRGDTKGLFYFTEWEPVQ